MSLAAFFYNNELIAAVSRRLFDGHRGGALLLPCGDERSAGLGQTLVEAACEAARAAGWKAVLLVGDAPYFTRAGFSAARTAGVAMPGPVDQRRVLLKALVEGGDEGLSGMVAVA